MPSSSSPQPRLIGLEVLRGRHAPVPKGFDVICIDLNKGAGGEHLYLAYKMATWGKPITAINVMYGHTSRLCPPHGYERINVDLNKGAGGDYVYLCYTKDDAFPPIRDVTVIHGRTPNVFPGDSNWYRVSVDLNKGAQGPYIFVCFKY